MAQITTSVHEHIEIVLSHLLHAWQYLPTAVREIDTWDIVDQIVYVEEWSPDQQLLEVLRKYDEDGALTEEQSARYLELLALVDTNRPLLDDLRESN